MKHFNFIFWLKYQWYSEIMNYDIIIKNKIQIFKINYWTWLYKRMKIFDKYTKCRGC